MERKRLKRIYRKIIFLPWTLYLNFKHLPLSQAIKLPVMCLCRVKFISTEGELIIDAPISQGMILLGDEVARYNDRGTLRWEIHGKVIFHGRARFTDDVCICCNDGGTLEFGDKVDFVNRNKIICSNRIVFGRKIMSSWNCTYCDTDFHPLFDIVSKRNMKISAPIVIGDDCWIGHDTIISKGVKLPLCTTVSSGSVVKGRFRAPYTIIGGNPAIMIDEGFMRGDGDSKEFLPDE